MMYAVGGGSGGSSGNILGQLMSDAGSEHTAQSTSLSLSLSLLRQNYKYTYIFLSFLRQYKDVSKYYISENLIQLNTKLYTKYSLYISNIDVTINSKFIVLLYFNIN